jgi:hypothetical protein
MKWKLQGLLSESTKALINRGIVVLFGFTATGVSFLAAVAPGTINQVSIALGGSIAGPLTGLFILGGVSKHGNWKGALIGGMGGLAINAWLTIGSLRLQRQHPTLHPVSVQRCLLPDNYTLIQPTYEYNFTDIPDHDGALNGVERLHSLSYIWYISLGSLMTVVLGLIASLILRDKTEKTEVDKLLLFPFREVFLCRDYCNDHSELRDNSRQVQLEIKSSVSAETELQPLRTETTAEEKSSEVGVNASPSRGVTGSHHDVTVLVQ